MRHVKSLGSAKAIWLDREEVLSRLRDVAKRAREKFPEIIDVRIFGSFAKGEELGTSDIDILIIANEGQPNPVDRIKPYFYFFSENLGIALDLLVLDVEEARNFEDRFGISFSLLRD